MKKTLYILSALLGMVTVAEAQIVTDMRKQDIVDGVSIENLRMERNGGYIAPCFLHQGWLMEMTRSICNQ